MIIRQWIARATKLVTGIAPLEKALSVADDAATFRTVLERFRDLVTAAVFIKQGEAASEKLRGIPGRFQADAKRVSQELTRFFVLKTEGNTLARKILQKQQDKIMDVETDLDGVLRSTKSLIEKSANAEMSRSAEKLREIFEGYRQHALKAIPAQTRADLPNDHIIYETSAYDSASVTSNDPLVSHVGAKSFFSCMTKTAIGVYVGNGALAGLVGGPGGMVIGGAIGFFAAVMMWSEAEKSKREQTHEKFMQAVVQDLATAGTATIEQIATALNADINSRVNSVLQYIERRVSANENLLQCYALEISQIEAIVDNSENLLSDIDVLLADLADLEEAARQKS